MTGRIFVVTGVTRGLGRALAVRLLELGHRVVGCGRTATALGSLRRLTATPDDFAAVDVSDDRAVRDWAEAVRAAVPAPDFLVCNAALIHDPAPLWEIQADEFDSVLDVNVGGVANVLRNFVPWMVAAGRGIVVNFTSGQVRASRPLTSPYAASKWAVEGMTRVLALELPEGMAAVAVNPGTTDTRMLRKILGPGAQGYPDAADWASRAVPVLLALGPADNGRSVTVPSRVADP